MRYHRPDGQAARSMQSFKLMQITFLVDRRRIGNPQPREAERFGPLGQAARLAGAAWEKHKPIVKTIGHGWHPPVETAANVSGWRRT